jgi:hypothetical protein
VGVELCEDLEQPAVSSHVEEDVIIADEWERDTAAEPQRRQYEEDWDEDNTIAAMRGRLGMGRSR